MRLVRTMQEKHGKTFAEAVRAAVATVLTSPDFLYLQEPTGADTKPHELNDYELASRLSYFLWSTMPDAELLDLAAQKKLRSPGSAPWPGQAHGRRPQGPAIRRELRRPVDARPRLRHGHGGHPPVPDYDDALRDASLREPYEFFHELLRADLSVLNLLDSDFLVINERLAKHYGIDGVEGEAFRRVPIKPEHHRGGILGMAGLLTYLADGTRTQPVKRGAYVLDVLWNTPRAAAAAQCRRFAGDQGQEPDRASAAGAASVGGVLRQLPRQDRSARPGAGELRRHRRLARAAERRRPQGDKNDPPIDASGVMPDGKAFKTLPEFKRPCWRKKANSSRASRKNSLAYALGRPIGATDRETVEQIMAEAAKRGLSPAGLAAGASWRTGPSRRKVTTTRPTKEFDDEHVDADGG